MKLETSVKWSLGVLGVMAIVLSVVEATSLFTDNPILNVIAPDQLKGDQSGVGLPARIRIPKIHVDAAIEYVGVTSDGAMGIPSGPSTTAWFDLGPRPGEIGTAVIDGHFGWKDNIPAVFDDLHTLQKGDILQVQDDKGVIITFVVREVRTYGKNQVKDAFGALGPSDGKAHLNLITCEGIWSKSQKSYADRLIVFADGGS